MLLASSGLGYVLVLAFALGMLMNRVVIPSTSK